MPLKVGVCSVKIDVRASLERRAVSKERVSVKENILFRKLVRSDMVFSTYATEDENLLAMLKQLTELYKKLESLFRIYRLTMNVLMMSTV